MFLSIVENSKLEEWKGGRLRVLVRGKEILNKVVREDLFLSRIRVRLCRR